MSIAVFFRFYNLDSIPPGLYPDVAINGNNALQSLETGNFLPFYSDNNGREGLIMWLDAVSMAIFGVTPLALKIPGAIFGVLTVLGIYLLATKMFVRRRYAIALLASFLLATSFWHTIFSRDGFRVILMPFFLVFAFYFFLKAFNSCKIFWAIFAGIFFGLGFYTYTGYRLAVPLLLVFLILWLFFDQKNRTAGFKITVTGLATTFFAALPIGLYFLQNPSDFIGRAGQTSVFSASQPLLELAKSLFLHLGMFNFYGDGNWRHNYPGAPVLFFPVGLLFLAGIWQALAIIINSFKRKAFNHEVKAYSFILSWLIIMLLPGILTYEGVPHSLRTFGVLPAVMILAASGGIGIYDWLKSRLPRIAAIGIFGFFIVTVIGGAYQDYFNHWAKSSDIPGAFTTQFVEIGVLSSELRREGWQTIIIVNENGTPVPYPEGIPMPSQTVQFIEKSKCFESGNGNNRTDCAQLSSYLTPSQIGRITINAKTAVIPMKNEGIVFENLQKLFPQGIIKQTNNIKYYEINQ